MMFGQNGIVAKAQNAKEQTLIEQYKEQVEFIRTETRMKYDSEPTLEQLKDAFDNDNQKSWVNKVEIIIDNGIYKIKLTTNDGYIFYITDKITEYKGKETMKETPATDEITADMVLFMPKDINWEVDNVKDALDYLFNN